MPQFVLLKFCAMTLLTYLLQRDIMKHKLKKPHEAPSALVTMKDRS